MNVRRHMLARGTKAAGWNIVRLLIIIVKHAVRLFFGDMIKERILSFESMRSCRASRLTYEISLWKIS